VIVFYNEKTTIPPGAHQLNVKARKRANKHYSKQWDSDRVFFVFDFSDVKLRNIEWQATLYRDGVAETTRWHSVEKREVLAMYKGVDLSQHANTKWVIKLKGTDANGRLVMDYVKKPWVLVFKSHLFQWVFADNFDLTEG